MNKLVAAALCSTAMLVGPAVYAQMTGGSATNEGTGGPYTTTNPPLTPSQVETSEGSISNPPPIDRSGNPQHVTDKDNSSGTGDGGDMSGLGGDDSADDGDDGEGDAAASDSGAAEGDAAGADAGGMGGGVAGAPGS